MLNSREHSSKSSEKLDKEVKSKYKMHKAKFIKIKLEKTFWLITRGVGKTLKNVIPKKTKNHIDYLNKEHLKFQKTFRDVVNALNN